MHPFIAASTFTLVEAARKSADGRFIARFAFAPDAQWFQGKGAYGGLLCAGIVRVMATLVDKARRPRTLHVHFCAPATGVLTNVDVVVEREGASISTLSARVTQEGKTIAFATATFASTRPKPSERARYQRRTMPSAPAPIDVPLLPRDVPFLPTFWQFFDCRFCVGAIPFSAHDDAHLGGWLRFRDPIDVDAPALAALADVLPPAVYARLDAPRPAASVDLTIDFFDGDIVPAEQHVLAVQSSFFGDGGTADERCELWSEDGRILCTVRQLVVLL
jgi:acyl-CoA thioesterase